MINALTKCLAQDFLYDDFRNKLKGIKSTDTVQNKEQLFISLFDIWCNNPVSTLILCFVSRNYRLAYNIIMRFAYI